MSEAKTGREFIKHEFDEAIAIQEAICACGRTLAEEHPLPATRPSLQRMVTKDEEHLRTLRTLGKPYGATGKQEEVAKALEELGSEVAKAAKGGPDSEKYELHAVVLNMKRKQQDSAAAMTKIAGKLKDPELKATFATMQKEIRASADELTKSLGDLATRIAMSGDQRNGGTRAATRATR